MKNDENEIKLAGRLGKDPEYRKTTGGHDVCRISLATNKKYKTLNGEWKQQTVWHIVEFYGKKALRALHRYKRGDHVRVIGESVPYYKMVNDVRCAYHLVRAHFIRRTHSSKTYSSNRTQPHTAQQPQSEHSDKTIPFDVSDFL